MRTECFDNFLMALYEESAFCFNGGVRDSYDLVDSERARRRFDRQFAVDYAVMMGARRRFAISPLEELCRRRRG